MYPAVSNVASDSLALPTSEPSQTGWLTLNAPQRGRITRVVVTQLDGTVENVACLVDIFNAAAAMSASAILIEQYRVLSQITLLGNTSNIVSFPTQSYCNADSTTGQPDNKLYIRINSQSNTAKHYKVTLTIET